MFLPSLPLLVGCFKESECFLYWHRVDVRCRLNFDNSFSSISTQHASLAVRYGMKGEAMSTKRVLSLLLGIALGFVMSSSAWAQATAQISGTVQDQSGAVLPGVQVTATQTETGVSRMTLSNETGTYTLPNLPVGPYRLEAGLPGFRTFVQTGIVLQVNANPTINISLEVGQV